MSTDSTTPAPSSSADPATFQWHRTVAQLPRSGLFEAVAVEALSGVRLVSRLAPTEELAIAQREEQVAAYEEDFGPPPGRPPGRLAPSEILERGMAEARAGRGGGR